MPTITEVENEMRKGGATMEQFDRFLDDFEAGKLPDVTDDSEVQAPATATTTTAPAQAQGGGIWEGIKNQYNTPKKIFENVATPALEMGGMALGGAVGLASPIPGGTAIGGGLGYAGGKSLARGIGETLGFTQPQGFTEGLKTVPSDIAEGAAFETLSPILGGAYRGLKGAPGAVKEFLFPMGKFKGQGQSYRVNPSPAPTPEVPRGTVNAPPPPPQTGLATVKPQTGFNTQGSPYFRPAPQAPAPPPPTLPSPPSQRSLPPSQRPPMLEGPVEGQGFSMGQQNPQYADLLARQAEERRIILGGEAVTPRSPAPPPAPRQLEGPTTGAGFRVMRPDETSLAVRNEAERKMSLYGDPQGRNITRLQAPMQDVTERVPINPRTPSKPQNTVTIDLDTGNIVEPLKKKAIEPIVEAPALPKTPFTPKPTDELPTSDPKSQLDFWERQRAKALEKLESGTASVRKSKTSNAWLYDIGNGVELPSPYSTKSKTLEYVNEKRNAAIKSLDKSGSYVKDNTVGIDIPFVENPKTPFTPKPTAPPTVEGEPLGSEAYNEVKKNPAGYYQLFRRGTRNEVFPNEKFKSPREAREFFRVAKVKESDTEAEAARHYANKLSLAVPLALGGAAATVGGLFSPREAEAGKIPAPVIEAAEGAIKKEAVPFMKKVAGWLNPIKHPSFETPEQGKAFFRFESEEAGKRLLTEKQIKRFRENLTPEQAKEQFMTGEGIGTVPATAGMEGKHEVARDFLKRSTDIYDKTDGMKGMAPRIKKWMPDVTEKMLVGGEYNPMKHRGQTSEARKSALGGRVYSEKLYEDVLRYESRLIAHQEKMIQFHESGIIHKAGNVKIGKRMMNSVNVADDLKYYEKRIKESPEIATPEFLAERDKLLVAEKQLAEQGENIPKNFKQVPAGYGDDMSGNWVPEAVYDHLVTTKDLLKPPTTFMGKAARKINVLFKSSKTIGNPSTYVSNFASSSFTQDMNGFHFGDQPKYIKKFLDMQKAFTPEYQALVRSGAIGGSYGEGELAILIKPNTTAKQFKQIVEDQLSKGVNKAAEVYDAIDNMMKGGSALHWMDKGKSMSEAVELGQHGSFNFKQVPSWVVSASQNVVPFARTGYKTANALFEALDVKGNTKAFGAKEAARRAGTAGLLIASPVTAAYKAYQLLDPMSPEEKNRALKTKTPNGTVFDVPVKEADGSYTWVNALKMSPFGAYSEAIDEGLEGNTAQAAGKLIPVGSPLISLGGLITQLIGKSIPKDPYTGQDIYFKTDDAWGKGRALTNYALNVMLPPLVHDLAAKNKTTPIMQVITGEKDKAAIGGTKKKSLTPIQRASKVFPFRASTQNEQEAAKSYRKDIRDIRRQGRSSGRYAAPEDKPSARQRTRDRIRRRKSYRQGD